MRETLLSVGVDLGTSTMQMIVSRLQMENTASAFTVPRMEITEREILYRSPVWFTPLLDARTLDAAAIGALLRKAYESAGIIPSEVQTGAVIITGETARKENARQVLEALSELAGEFVVATAGPALECVLAARGAGADRRARQLGRYVLHMDIGGGTANLALFDPDGNLADTGCLNVGGRLIKLTRQGEITYVSPVLAGQTALRVGDRVTQAELQSVTDRLVQALEEAAGFRAPTECLTHFITDKTVSLPDAPMVLSFSGGVADLIESREDWLRYGDIGVLLGQAIRKSPLCAGHYVLGSETIRATVVGAGSYATELSGSTVYYANVTFPLQNLPVVTTRETLEDLPEKLRQFDPQEPTAVFWQGREASFAGLNRLADTVAAEMKHRAQPLVVITCGDLAKALGHALAARLPRGSGIVCLDSLHIPEGSYLDIGEPVGGTALPVVIKTLAFETNHGRNTL